MHYTIWVPLCPLAFVFEGVITLRDIPFFEESERFSVSLPNQANFAFYFPNLLRFYLLFCFFPIMYNMMQQMYRSRCKKLNIKQHSANKRSWWEKITNKEDWKYLLNIPSIIISHCNISLIINIVIIFHHFQWKKITFLWRQLRKMEL